LADRDRSQRHWNTVDVDGSIAADEVTEMVEHSDELVVGDLTHA
jgi:predicted DNA-binding protein (MmcQ/YjbR family)